MTPGPKLNFSPFPVMETERLVLRQLNEADRDVVFSLRSSPEVNEYLDREKALHVDEASAFIYRINLAVSQSKAVYWGIELKENSKIIGTICLWNIFPESGSAETGYELLPQYQGRGYLRECLVKVMKFGFVNMELKKITGCVHPENRKSIKILEDFGFVKAALAEDRNEIIYEKSNPALSAEL